MEGLRDAGFYGVDVLKEQIRELDELEDTKKDSVKAVFFRASGGCCKLWSKRGQESIASTDARSMKFLEKALTLIVNQSS